MKLYIYLAIIFILYGFASNEDYKDQVLTEQSRIVDCDTDYDCMLKNPNIEGY
jgi:hypothetical protein